MLMNRAEPACINTAVVRSMSSKPVVEVELRLSASLVYACVDAGKFGFTNPAT
jgi:hypothetical protein